VRSAGSRWRARRISSKEIAGYSKAMLHHGDANLGAP
jgi:hypothetical protein